MFGFFKSGPESPKSGENKPTAERRSGDHHENIVSIRNLGFNPDHHVSVKELKVREGSTTRQLQPGEFGHRSDDRNTVHLRPAEDETADRNLVETRRDMLDLKDTGKEMYEKLERMGYKDVGAVIVEKDED